MTVWNKFYILQIIFQLKYFKWVITIVTRLGNLLDFLATINLPKSLTFLSNFCKGVKIYRFSSAIIFGQLLQTFGDFFLITLVITGILIVYLRSLQTPTQFYTTNKCENDPSGMQHWDPSSQPLGHESLPLTTRTRAPAQHKSFTF